MDTGYTWILSVAPVTYMVVVYTTESKFKEIEGLRRGPLTVLGEYSSLRTKVFKATPTKLVMEDTEGVLTP